LDSCDELPGRRTGAVTWASTGGCPVFILKDLRCPRCREPTTTKRPGSCSKPRKNHSGSAARSGTPGNRRDRKNRPPPGRSSASPRKRRQQKTRLTAQGKASPLYQLPSLRRHTKNARRGGEPGGPEAQSSGSAPADPRRGRGPKHEDPPDGTGGRGVNVGKERNQPNQRGGGTFHKMHLCRIPLPRTPAEISPPNPPPSDTAETPSHRANPTNRNAPTSISQHGVPTASDKLRDRLKEARNRLPGTPTQRIRLFRNPRPGSPKSKIQRRMPSTNGAGRNDR